MRRLVVLGAVLVLAGCGTAASDTVISDTSVSGTPAPETVGHSLPPVEPTAVETESDSVIVVPPDSEIARMLGENTPADRFVATDDVSLAPGMAALWEMSTDPATDDEVAALADALGIDGDVRAGDPSSGETRVVGSLDDGPGQLQVADYAEPTWGVQSSQDAFARSGADGSGDVALATDIDAVVDDVMATIGVEPADYTVDSFAGGQVADVRIEFTPGGLRTDVQWTLSIAPDGSILGGGGLVRAPTIVRDVWTVDLDEALLRLSRVSPGAPSVPVPIDSSGSPATTRVPPPATTPAPPSTPPSPLTPPLAPVVDGTTNPAITVAPPTPPAGPIVRPTISSIEAGLVSVWDVSNRKWLVPAIVVSSGDVFTTTVPIIGAGHLRIADQSEIAVPVRTGPPLTIPAPPSGSATTMLAAPSTMSLPTGSGLPRPTIPEPPATLLTPDGTPVTIPIPPDPNEIDPADIPAFYAESLDAVLVGRALDDAIDLLERTGWTVRTDDADDPGETFTADLAIARATVRHRNDIVIGVAVG